MINETALQEFIDWRRDELKKPMTPLAIKKLRTKLEPFTDAEQVKALDRAIKGRWSGVFPEKERQIVKTNSTRDLTLEDQLNDRSWAR